MEHHEKTLMAFDDFGREYMIDVFTSNKELNEMAQGGAIQGGLPTFRTLEGHTATYLGGGEFSVRVPGEGEAVTVRTDDPDYT